jgi:hypothetical protein
MNNIHEGDLVKVYGLEGPTMLVQSVEPPALIAPNSDSHTGWLANCVWYTSNGEITDHRFNENCLILVQSAASVAVEIEAQTEMDNRYRKFR